jgi:glutaminyl-peptide cyclotransferase
VPRDSSLVREERITYNWAMNCRLLACLILSIAAVSPAFAQSPDASAFDGKRAYDYLREICSYGNRMSGSEGMRRQQELLEKHFKELAVEANYQRLTVNHPQTRKPVELANMIVEFYPDRTERILMCAHYDTRPLPDQDPEPRRRREGVFLGANDGASGVSVLMELGHHVKLLPEKYGLDFVFFDAEELVYSDRRDRYFLGSEHFARTYAKGDRNFEYVAGVLLDMVGDSKLSIYQERHSVGWKETRPIVQGIWDTAAKLEITEFIPRVGYEVRDDHLPLYQIAGIPVCDVIDFAYPDRWNGYWHTTQDTPGRCSAESLGKVGRVMLEWLRSAK